MEEDHSDEGIGESLRQVMVLDITLFPDVICAQTNCWI